MFFGLQTIDRGICGRTIHFFRGFVECLNLTFFPTQLSEIGRLVKNNDKFFCGVEFQLRHEEIMWEMLIGVIARMGE